MSNRNEENIGYQQLGEEIQEMRAVIQKVTQDKQAIRYGYNLAIFDAYAARLAHLTPEGVRENVMVDWDPEQCQRIDFTNVPDSKFKVSRKTFKHDETDQTLFDDIGIIDGVSQSEVISTESMRFAVKHVNERSTLSEQYFNLVCPEFNKVPGVSSPKGLKPDWISLVVVTESQLKSIKALL